MDDIQSKTTAAHRLESLGAIVLRYGLVLVVAWIGCLKFTAYEAEGVFKHASHSPLLSWAYQFSSVRGFSRGLGIVELTLAALIALRPVWAKASAIGSLGGVAMFLTTLSFLITTPGVWQEGYGFPALSASPGQFLAKDVVLLGAAIWTAGEALRAAHTRGEMPTTHRAGGVRSPIGPQSPSYFEYPRSAQ